jgi:hypothetical protein
MATRKRKSTGKPKGRKTSAAKPAARKKTAARKPAKKAPVKRAAPKKAKPAAKPAAAKPAPVSPAQPVMAKPTPMAPRPPSPPPRPAAPAPAPAPTPPPQPAPPPGERIGVVTHYYGHLGVAIIKLESAGLRVGDTIHIRGHTTDFSQQVQSMEVEHRSVTEVGPNDDFGLKVIAHAREHDVVYKVK